MLDTQRTLPRRIAPRARHGAEAGGADLKWYFATNAAGCEGIAGLHAKLAVLSARRNTRLRPHLITTGFRNAFTDWMEAQGVTVIDGRSPLAETIRKAEAAGFYHTRFLGHWLRCEIPLIETTDDYVLYTDTDVVFLDRFVLPQILPKYIACAPEFRIGELNYFNSGIMLMNVHNMRCTMTDFLAAIRWQIDGFRESSHNDQFAYNSFYREVWTPLDPRYNWKPYWGDPSDAAILHFHGAKIPDIWSIFTLDLPWGEVYWQQIGSLVASFTRGYRISVERTLAALGDAELPERPWLETLAAHLAGSLPPVPAEVIDLSLLDTQMQFDPVSPCQREPQGWRARIIQTLAGQPGGLRAG